MRSLRYKVTYQDDMGTWTQTIDVQALNINKGMKRALNIFEKNMPKDWELCSIEFWEVLS